MNDLKLEITSKAITDIEIIADYITKDNRAYATNILEVLFPLIFLV